MWRVLLELLAETRRPLVVIDFETAGLSGAPPVEFATLTWAPWRTPEDDDETRAMRPHVPPGLTYACSQRLNPGQPIDPGATAVHGITDADVAGCMSWSDLQVRAYFLGLAAGDAAEGDGPAVFVGHNLQAADLAWGRRWGYFPAAEVDAVDTLRLRYRLGREHPFPMSPDAASPPAESWSTEAGGWGCPAVTFGLDAFAANLAGLHVAMCGVRPEGAHGAMADAAATARVFARILDLWDSLWFARSPAPTAEVRLRQMLAALDAPEPGAVSWDGWLGSAPGGGYVWRKGKFKGRPAHRDQYVLDLPRLPTGDDAASWWCSQHTADILAGLRPMAAVR